MTRATEARAKWHAWRSRAFQVFASSAYRTYFLGLLASMLGFWVRIAAMGWLVYEITGRKDRLGEVAVASLLPWVIVSPLSGSWADRWHPRAIMQGALLCAVLANVALAWLLAAGHAPYPVLLAWCVVAGIVRGIENPARQSFVRCLVEREQLPSAIGMNAAGFHCMGALGFALAGWLYHWTGPEGCFLAVAALTLPLIAQAHRLRRLPPPERSENGLRGLAALREGFRYVAREPNVRLLITSAFLLVVLLLSYRTIMPAIAKDRLGLGEAGYGQLMSLAGWGALGAALWVAGASADLGQRARRLVALAVLSCVALLLIAFASTSVICGIGVLLAGFSQVGFMAGANSTMQQIIPDTMRGRVLGIWALMFGAGFPLGSWVLGELAEAWGSERALTVTVCATIALGGLLVAFLRKE